MPIMCKIMQKLFWFFLTEKIYNLKYYIFFIATEVCFIQIGYFLLENLTIKSSA